ncbi:MAG: hypothetical protein ACRD2D_11160, partial [Terriglobales bacterium]
ITATAAPVPVPVPVRVPIPMAEPAAPTGDPTGAVLEVLENQGRAALLSVLGKAQWNWQGDELELAFAPAEAALAKLAQSAPNRKALEEACRAGMGRTVGVTVSTREATAGGAAPVVAAVKPELGSLEARAQQHARLRELRERIPSHVLRTREWEP